MATLISKKETRKKLSRINIRALIAHYIHNRETSLRTLSIEMGMEESYLAEALKRKDMSMSLLLTLSKLLSVNLLEYYFPLLPENLRVTKRQQELQQQVSVLEQKILDLEKERDWLKEAVMKR